MIFGGAKEKRDQQEKKQTEKSKKKTKQKKDIDDMRGLALSTSKSKKKKNKKKGRGATTATDSATVPATLDDNSAEITAQSEEWERLDKLKVDQKFAEDMRAALTESSATGTSNNAKQRRKEERAKKTAAIPLNQFLQTGSNTAAGGDAPSDRSSWDHTPREPQPHHSSKNVVDVERAVQLALAQEKLREAAPSDSISRARAEVSKGESVRGAKSEMDKLKSANQDLQSQVEHLTNMLMDMTQMLQAADKADVVQVKFGEKWRCVYMQR